jgi:hypothetical protein
MDCSCACVYFVGLCLEIIFLAEDLVRGIVGLGSSIVLGLYSGTLSLPFHLELCGTIGVDYVFDIDTSFGVEPLETLSTIFFFISMFS